MEVNPNEPRIPCIHDPDDHPLHRLLQHVVRRSIHELHALLQELQLSLPQLGTLHVLRAEGAQSVSAIAQHVQLSLAATSHLVDRLVQRGLLTRSEDPSDRRQKRVDLTSEGRAVVGGVQAKARASLEALLAEVPPDLRRRFDQDLREVLDTLEPPSAPVGRAPLRSEP
ncbi:MAG: MarR family transcriptional regulator [Trueperaceae bacterium]|nr:MarR family transcriptional regulator [Trueperaceae bacterium]